MNAFVHFLDRIIHTFRNTIPYHKAKGTVKSRQYTVLGPLCAFRLSCELFFELHSKFDRNKTKIRTMS